MFSFAEEQLTFTAYYPSPNAFYNQLNTTYLKVNKDALVGGFLGVGEYTPTADSDIYVKRNNEPASLMLYGQGEVGVSNNADLILASPGFPASPNDPNVWAMSHDMNNSLVYLHHRSGSTGFNPVLTMDNDGNIGLNTTNPQAPFHILSERRDLMRVESDSANGSGIMFRNRHADMGNNQYFGMGWGGSAANNRRDKFNFWYARDDTVYDSPPIMTFYKNETVGIRNQGPLFTLGVGGGARFDTDAVGEDFIVEDHKKGSFNYVMHYDYSTGKIYLGNEDGTTSDAPEVTIRDDLWVEKNITVAGKIRGASWGFGGVYEIGESDVYGQTTCPPGSTASPCYCETKNPLTNACSCPPGFTAASTSTTIETEESSSWDSIVFCWR